MTVTTIFAGTGDGEVLSQHNSSYSAARTGSGSTKFLNANTTSFLTVGQFKSGAQFNCYEAFMEFNTASIADDQVVSDAVLAWDGAGDQSATDFLAEARQFDHGGTISTADWISGADLGSYTLLATWNSSSYSTSYSNFTSETGFAAAISVTAALRIVIASDRLRSGTEPTGSEYVQMRSADTSGTSEDPKLTVTHDTAATFTPRLTLLGVG